MSSSNTGSGSNTSGNAGGSSSSTSGSTDQGYAKEQQQASKADVTKALADPTNIETMQRWGSSSKERRDKKVCA
jgi:hypothetical protein